MTGKLTGSLMLAGYDYPDFHAYVLETKRERNVDIILLDCGTVLSIHMDRAQTERLIADLTAFVTRPAADIYGNPIPSGLTISNAKEAGRDPK